MFGSSQSSPIRKGGEYNKFNGPTLKNTNKPVNKFIKLKIQLETLGRDSHFAQRAKREHASDCGHFVSSAFRQCKVGKQQESQFQHEKPTIPTCQNRLNVTYDRWHTTTTNCDLLSATWETTRRLSAPFPRTQLTGHRGQNLSMCLLYTHNNNKIANDVGYTYYIYTHYIHLLNTIHA